VEGRCRQNNKWLITNQQEYQIDKAIFEEKSLKKLIVDRTLSTMQKYCFSDVKKYPS
jgi:hypothetical protein